MGGAKDCRVLAATSHKRVGRWLLCGANAVAGVDVASIQRYMQSCLTSC
jgi:hypothetical protein